MLEMEEMTKKVVRNFGRRNKNFGLKKVIRKFGSASRMTLFSPPKPRAKFSPMNKVIIKGVQYVHCVMHRCILVELGGNEEHIKYVNKTFKFYKIRGKFAKVGGK